MPFLPRRSNPVLAAVAEQINQARYVDCRFFLAQMRNAWRCDYCDQPVYRHQPKTRPYPWRNRP